MIPEEQAPQEMQVPQEQAPEQEGQNTVMDALKSLQVVALAAKEKGNEAPAQLLAQFMQSISGGQPQEGMQPERQPQQGMGQGMGRGMGQGVNRDINNASGSIPV